MRYLGWPCFEKEIVLGDSSGQEVRIPIMGSLHEGQHVEYYPGSRPWIAASDKSSGWLVKASAKTSQVPVRDGRIWLPVGSKIAVFQFGFGIQGGFEYDEALIAVPFGRFFAVDYASHGQRVLTLCSSTGVSMMSELSTMEKLSRQGKDMPALIALKELWHR